MYVLSRKNKSEIKFGKYEYRKSFKNGVEEVTPSLEDAEKFTEGEAANGVSALDHGWDLIKLSSAKRRKQHD